jgi:hypothetical protein
MMQMEFPLVWSLVDTLNETYFYRQPVDEKLRCSVSDRLYDWLKTMSADMEKDPAQVRPLDGAMLFTGERLKTQFAARHILLLEGGLALFRFGVGRDEEIALLQRVGRLVGKVCFARQCLQGECALATVAWMRWLSAGLSPLAGPGIDHFLGLMMENRDGKGRWVQFPFYYTLLALEEMRPAIARREMLYAASACRRIAARNAGEDMQERRRRDLAQRILRAENPLSG